MNQFQEYSIKGVSLAAIFPETVVEHLTISRFQKGEPILLAGETVSHLYIVLSGRCAVKQIGQDGQETIVGYVQAGDMVGEIELFTNHFCQHYVYADATTALLSIPKPLVTGELLSHVPFVRFVLDGAFGKLLARTTYFSETRLYGHKSQTVTYIKELEKRLGTSTVPFVVTEVAPFIGVSERHLRRILKELQQEGLITKRYKRIEIHGL